MDAFTLSCAIMSCAPKGEPLTDKRLNCLAYLGYLDSLKAGQQLFDDTIKATAQGVSVASVHDHFWSYMSQPVSVNPLTKFKPAQLAAADDIWRAYGELSQEELDQLIQAPDGPWSRARQRAGANQPTIMDERDFQVMSD